jgi:hypothetical protein
MPFATIQPTRGKERKIAPWVLVDHRNGCRFLYHDREGALRLAAKIEQAEADFPRFLADVKALGLTRAQVRCEVPPTEAVLDLIGRYPDYELLAGRAIFLRKI